MPAACQQHIKKLMGDVDSDAEFWDSVKTD